MFYRAGHVPEAKLSDVVERLIVIIRGART
jgi:hypothetical protein